MVSTRQNPSPPSPLPKPPHNRSSKLAHELQLLARGGCAGRHFSGHANRRSSEVADHEKWFLDYEYCQPCQPISDDMVPQSLPDRTPEVEDVHQEHPDRYPNIILRKDNLRKVISDDLTCKHCALTQHKRANKEFLSFLEAELDLSPCQSASLWIKFVRKKKNGTL